MNKNHQNSRNRNSSLMLTVVALIGTFAIGELAADDAATLVSRANEAMREGNAEEALSDYQQAEEAQPDRFEPLYNQAVAHYRMGQLAEARELFTQVLGTSDRDLEAKARFNLANCDYSEAVAASEQDRPAAIEQLKKAISHYRGALHADSSDTDSRANIELAKMLIDQLKEEEKQEQEKQQQQDQNQDRQKNDDQQSNSKDDQDQQNQDKSKQNDDSQQNKEPQDQAESNQDKSDDQQKSEESKPDKGNAESESDREQNDKGEQGDKGNENDNKPDNTDGESDAENERPQNEDSFGEQEDQQQQDANQQAQPKSPDGDLEQQQEEEKPSTGATGEPQRESDGQPSGGHVQKVSETEARPMTQEEAQKMLQAVRDRDMMRRYEKLRQLQRLKVPVDRDW